VDLAAIGIPASDNSELIFSAIIFAAICCVILMILVAREARRNQREAKLPPGAPESGGRWQPEDDDGFDDGAAAGGDGFNVFVGRAHSADNFDTLDRKSIASKGSTHKNEPDSFDLAAAGLENFASSNLGQSQGEVRQNPLFGQNEVFGFGFDGEDEDPDAVERNARAKPIPKAWKPTTGFDLNKLPPPPSEKNMYMDPSKYPSSYSSSFGASMGGGGGGGGGMRGPPKGFGFDPNDLDEEDGGPRRSPPPRRTLHDIGGESPGPDWSLVNGKRVDGGGQRMKTVDLGGNFDPRFGEVEEYRKGPAPKMNLVDLIGGLDGAPAARPPQEPPKRMKVIDLASL
jgi:hypothetical protein